MLGWFNEARTCASRWKRASRSASAATDSGRTLIATSRFRFVSRRAIDLAHAPRAEWRDDLVGT